MGFNDILGSESSFSNLTPAEREVFKTILMEEASRRSKASVPIQLRDIVDINTWLDSEYYVGPDVVRIYDYWKELIADVFDNNRNKDNTINEVILSGALGVGKSCLSVDTRIPTSLGLLTLKQLYEEFHVKGNRFTVRAESGIKNCIDVFDNGMAETYKIRMESGREIEATANHKFRIIRNGRIEWVRVDDIKSEDNFLMTREKHVFGSKSIGEDAAYVLGYMVGDGWCGNPNTMNMTDETHIIECGGFKIRSVLHNGSLWWVLRDIREAFNIPYINQKKFSDDEMCVVSLFDCRESKNQRNHAVIVSEDWIKKVLCSRIKDEGKRKIFVDWLVDLLVCSKSMDILEKPAVWETRYDNFAVMYQKEQTSVAEVIERQWVRWFGKIDNESRTSKLKNGNTMITLRGYNVSMATKLVKSGFGSGAADKGVPSDIFQCVRSEVASFIRGLFDSDGTIGKNGSISLTLKSEKCIRQVASLLSMFGINYKIESNQIDSGEYYHDIFIHGTKSFEVFHKEIGFLIDYKKDRLEKKISKCGGRNDREIVPDAVNVLRELYRYKNIDVRGRMHFLKQDNYTLRALRMLYDEVPEWVSRSEYLRFVCENDVFFDCVESVVSKGNNPTMDLTIEEDHSYCFDGFISHNTCAELIVMRKLYELSCYKNVHALFDLMGKTHIAFVYFSINKVQAERTGYGEMKDWIDSSPYFRENFQRNMNIDSLMVFPEKILIAYGSGFGDSIGMSMIGSILDEANFFRGSAGSEVSKVSELYSSLVNRSSSRFIVDGGTNHSINVLVSSSTNESSFTNQRIVKSADNPHVLVRSPNQWEVKPEKFSGRFFYVCVGTNTLDPYIVKSVDDIEQYRLSEGMKKVEIEYSEGDTVEDRIRREIESFPDFKKKDFISVPVDLKSNFETNLIKSLQDFGGVSVAPMGRLFTSKPVYQAACRDNILHPFYMESITISTGDDIRIQDFLKKEFHFKDIGRPRYLHIDQSLTNDSTGIACVYVSNIVEEDNVQKPIFEVDFMLRINPPKPPKRIAIYKIRDFIIYLNKAMNMKIGKLTYDTFNSEESKQILGEMGYNVGHQSVDRNDRAYVDLVTLLFEGRFHIYDYEPFKSELFSLIHDRQRRKVDHPKEDGEGLPGCFFADTKVLTKEGLVRIDDLADREGPFDVWAIDETGNRVIAKAKKAFRSKYIYYYVKVEFESGFIHYCTPDHRFMLLDGTYREIQDVKKEDKIKTVEGYDMVTNLSFDVSDDRIYVYDLEVPETGNFVIEGNIVVHNSKDVTDAVAGALENALQSNFSSHYSSNNIDDFLYANSFNTIAGIEGEPGVVRKYRVEDLIDMEIDEMIDEFDCY